MTVKTLFDPASGRILGAQIVGFDGVDKRMDVLAAAIRRASPPNSSPSWIWPTRPLRLGQGSGEYGWLCD
ncbi:MAG: hypothetical protein ACLRIS_15880 [Flavonifractor plautii]